MKRALTAVLVLVAGLGGAAGARAAGGPAPTSAPALAPACRSDLVLAVRSLRLPPAKKATMLDDFPVLTVAIENRGKVECEVVYMGCSYLIDNFEIVSAAPPMGLEFPVGCDKNAPHVETLAAGGAHEMTLWVAPKKALERGGEVTLSLRFKSMADSGRGAFSVDSGARKVIVGPAGG